MTSPKTSASTSSTAPGGVDAEPAPVAAAFGKARAAIGPSTRETNAGEREQVAGPRAGAARGTATSSEAREAQQETTQPADSTASDGRGERGGAATPGAREALAAAMSEAGLESHVRALIKGLGLWGFHPFDSRRSKEGWPDWAIIGNRIIYRELKAERGRVSPAQRTVGELLTGAGADWAIWRPSDLISGRIARELTAISSLARTA